MKDDPVSTMAFEADDDTDSSLRPIKIWSTVICQSFEDVTGRYVISPIEENNNMSISEFESLTRIDVHELVKKRRTFKQTVVDSSKNELASIRKILVLISSLVEPY